jgi:transposase
MAIKYSDEEVKNICKFYDSGNSILDVAKHFNIPLGTVHFILKRGNATIRTFSEAAGGVDINILTSLYNSGKSTCEVAKEVGIASSSVYTRLIKAGIKLRTKKEAVNRIIPKDQEQKVIEDYQSGMRVSDIRKKWGVSKDVVRRIMADHGVKARGDKPARAVGFTIYDEESHDLAVQMYNDGLSSEDIGQKLNIPESSVAAMLKRRNVIKREATETYQKASIEALKELYESGMSVEEIIKKFDYASVKSVKTKLRNAGVILRKIKRPTCRIPKIHWQTIVDRYCKGESSTEIGKTYTLHRNVILQILHEMNAPIRQRKYGHQVGGYTGKRDNLSYRIRNCQKYIDWRAAVWKRDYFTCRDCDQVGKDLEAHHLKPFYQIFNDFAELLEGCDNTPDIITERAQHYLPFWDTNNGLTLCKECHVKRTRDTDFIAT